jgi:hypothetical protein
VALNTRRVKRAAVAATAAAHRRDGQRHQRTRAQLLPRRLGVVGLQQAGGGLAVGVEGLEAVGGHRRLSRV